MLRYLPVQAGDWVVGLPLAAVVEVRAFRNSGAAEPTAAGESATSPLVEVPALTLSALLGDIELVKPTQYGIMMSCQQGIFGLLVEGMELPQTVSSVDPLPLLIASPLFSSVISHNYASVMMLDVEMIGQTIYQSAARKGQDD